MRPEKIRRAYDELFSRVRAIFTRDGAQRVPWRDRLAVTEALGEVGDFRLQERDVDRLLEVPGGKGVKLGKYPVTVQEYAAFVADGGYGVERYWIIGRNLKRWDRRFHRTEPVAWEKQLRTPNRPVVGVSWYEAMAYCAWRSEKLRLDPPLRLPTEEEWQAAATNPKGPYPWGAEEPTQEHANWGDNVGHPTPVGMYPLGEAPGGYWDMAGNVWEWCVSTEPENRQPLSFLPYFGAHPVYSPQDYLRGGSYWHNAVYLRSDGRVGRSVDDRDDVFGFRLAQSPASFGG